MYTTQNVGHSKHNQALNKSLTIKREMATFLSLHVIPAVLLVRACRGKHGEHTHIHTHAREHLRMHTLRAHTHTHCARMHTQTQPTFTEIAFRLSSHFAHNFRTLKTAVFETQTAMSHKTLPFIKKKKEPVSLATALHVK